MSYFHSLRVRLLLLLVGTVFLTTLLTGIGSGIALEHELRERFNEALTRNATELTHEDVLHILFSDDLLIVGWGVLGATIIAIGMGFWWAGIILRPIRAMTETAEKVSLTNANHGMSYRGPAGDELAGLAKTLDRMLARLRSSAERLKRFTSDASHELRTPLASLRLAIDVALKRGTKEAYESALQHAKTETLALTTLTERLLVLARVDKDDLKLQRQSCQLEKICEAEIARITPLATAKRIQLISRLTNVKLSADPTLLARIIMNLLQNAVQHSPKNGKVHIMLTANTKQVELAVEDAGPGIAPKDQKRIFERFYRADASRSIGGAGLGLAIASEIAILHGGKLTVASKLGHGAKFTLTLPR